MKKRKSAFFLAAGMLTVSLLFSGCGGEREEKAQQYRELGLKQLEAGAYEDAASSFQKVLDQSRGHVGPEEIDACYYKALAQYRSGDMEGALASYDALVEYDDENWEAYYLRGSAYLQDGQGERGMDDYEKAVSLNKADLELYARIYENLAAAGYEQEGQAYLDQALSREPDSADDFYSVGYLCFLKGNTGDAVQYLEKAADQGRDEALLRLGRVYAEQGDIDAARSAFTQYMEKHPQDASALTELGNMAMSAESYEDAVGYFRQAIEASGEDSTRSIRRSLIAACERAGDFETACSEAAAYLEEYGDDAEIQREYLFLQTRTAEGTVALPAQDDADGADETVITGEIQ